ncbi:hypothetical protein EDB89DRAFT_2074234 [Lactarius sanguifluus]|nr:hypothetical protein EDB89DRAFT_2074234 [Lactarius sanguifluus]
MTTTPPTQPFNGLPPTIFDGDRSYSRAFLTQFRTFARINQRHTDVTYPHRRVKLALSFIHGPLVNDWKRTTYHGLAAIPTGEAWWDEFIRAFTAAWIDDPVAPDESLFAPRASVPMPSIRAVLGSLTPAAASTTTLADDEEDWALFAPRVASDPTPLVTPAAPRIEKRKQHDTSDEEETHPSKHPRIAPRTGPPRARPQLGRRSVPLPRKIAYKPRHAPSAPVLSITPFLVPYSPPPCRPPSPPNNPDHAPPLIDPDPRPLAPGRTVAEDDNTLTGGVKTLDDSVFAPVSAQDDEVSNPHTGGSRPQTPCLTPDTTDLSLQTPPRIYLFPRHALERPRDLDELATRTPDQRRRGNTRTPYPTTSHNHARHARQTRSTTAPEDTTPTSVASRHTRRGRRANAAAPSTSPPPDRIATRTRDRHVHAAHRRNTPHLKPPTRTSLDVSSCNALRPAPRTTRFDSRPVPRSATIDTPLSVDTAKTTSETNRANAAVELFLRQYDAAQTTATPTPVPPDRAYDAVAQHLAYCLVTDPDTTRVTQPFTLQDKPRAVLLQWKKR